MVISHFQVKILFYVKYDFLDKYHLKVQTMYSKFSQNFLTQFASNKTYLENIMYTCIVKLRNPTVIIISLIYMYNNIEQKYKL